MPDAFADALILAAGQGTRMPSPRPKVLQTLLGQSMLSLVCSALARMPEVDRVITVVGHQAELVRDDLRAAWNILDLPGEALCVEQRERRGTGHALLTALPALSDSRRSHLLLVCGDTPLLDPALLGLFVRAAHSCDAAFLSVTLDDPASYGRIVRPHGPDSPATAIVEAKDYDQAVLGPASGEINSGVCLFRLDALARLLPLLRNDNQSGEYYLTDILALAHEQGYKADAFRAEALNGGDPARAIRSLGGVNNPRELAQAEESLRRDVVDGLLASGVIVHAPESVRVSPLARIAPGCELSGPCEIYGATSIARGVSVESHCLLKNADIASDARIRAFSHVEDARVGEACLVGPYARLRPGSLMEKNAHLGNFVEMKKARLGEGAKANHLSYLGDADIGPGVNIGAGTITCNYDGVNKHKTVIKAGAFIGSNTALVAPIAVGENSLVGAGSVLSKDVPDKHLAVTRPRLTLIKRREAGKRPNSKNPMKAIAFYLPQFHVIEENERIYGKNFTEWNNVRAALPLFPGHYQPHEPHESLGYYDLTDERAVIAQHNLAYDNGITGFCYYYYNMDGRELLEKPLKLINENENIRNEFCLCWDHSSWYDNTLPERTVPFLEQVYSPENARKLIQGLACYFRNPRYIRVDGKPLFLVWTPERHPDIQSYARVWREEAARMGFVGLCLAGVEAFVGGRHPEAYGLDCMVEFAPNWRHEYQLSPPGETPRRLDYIKTVQGMLAKEIPDYIRLRCAFPAWDNTPRRGAKGIACVNSSPEAFAIMLESMAEYTKEVLPDSMQYLFINAWNEWGEGCHLEPDKRYRFTYLNIARAIMRKYGETGSR